MLGTSDNLLTEIVFKAYAVSNTAASHCTRLTLLRTLFPQIQSSRPCPYVVKQPRGD